MIKRVVQNLLYKDLSYAVHGAAIEVRKDFGPGHKEKLYQEAFAEELKRREILFEKEQAIKIYSPKDGKYTGLYRPDFIVDEKIIVETKAEKFVSRDEIKRIYDYLRNSKCELAYLINFASPKLFVKRIIYTNDRKPFGNPTINTNKKLNNTKKLLVAIGLILVLFSGAKIASAASLYFSPSSGTHAIGTSFTVSIYVSSADQAMNAASGIISFPSDNLEVTSLSKTGSIFTLWVQEPSFSNSAGTVNFEGIVLNPGFTGANGKAITITFRTKAAGNTPLTFSSGSALANDGKGTNILTGLGDANFSIGVVGPGAPEIVTPAEVVGTPEAPAISSPTHPDPNKWYAVKEAKFTWDVPKDATAVRLLVGRIPSAIPTITYTSPINSKEVADLADGIWYFSVRLKNNAGWGVVSHFRFQIDTDPPEPFTIKFANGKETENPRPTVTVDHEDAVSGVEGHCLVKIDNGEWFPSNYEIGIEKPGSFHTFRLPLQNPGKHIVVVKALDLAGNYTMASEEFTIMPLFTPEIIEYSHTLQSGEILTLKGETKYPDAQINIFLQHEKDEVKSYSVKSDKDGKFTFVAEDRLSSGIYTAWAEVEDERGAKSEPSEKVTIAVERPAFLRIGSWAVGFLSVVVPLIALVLLLVYLSWHWWHKFATMRKRVKKEIREAEQALHKAFDLLKVAIREQIKILEKIKTKRQLTEEEEKIIKQLKRDLDDAEKFVRKEIEDIEKEVK